MSLHSLSCTKSREQPEMQALVMDQVPAWLFCFDLVVASDDI